jgi:hypothetical protein
MFYTTEYAIGVEIPVLIPLHELLVQLQKACEHGVEAQFQVLQTAAPTYLILFVRDADLDADHVSKRMEHTNDDPKRAAMLQLAEEIAEVCDTDLDPIVENLRAGKAQAFDFDGGGFKTLTGDMTPVIIDGPKVVRPLNAVGGLYIQINRDTDVPFRRFKKALDQIALQHGFDPHASGSVGGTCSHGVNTVTNAVWYHDRLRG